MKYLGIDYGSKYIGLARSDDLGQIAFPWQIIKNDKTALLKIIELIKLDNFKAIIIGQSINQEGEDNRFQKIVIDFKEKLKESGLPIYFQDERFSSVSVSQMKRWSEKNESRKSKELASHDKEAAVILQRFLETNKNKND